jgi:DNA-binding IscR family transcriptional regulator
MSAGMIAFNHQVATGQPITPGELAKRLNIPLTYAESLIDHLGDSSPVTTVNGTAINGSRP